LLYGSVKCNNAPESKDDRQLITPPYNIILYSSQRCKRSKTKDS